MFHVEHVVVTSMYVQLCVYKWQKLFGFFALEQRGGSCERRCPREGFQVRPQDVTIVALWPSRRAPAPSKSGKERGTRHEAP